jgi:hypothetical protein
MFFNKIAGFALLFQPFASQIQLGSLQFFLAHAGTLEVSKARVCKPDGDSDIRQTERLEVADLVRSAAYYRWKFTKHHI